MPNIGVLEGFTLSRERRRPVAIVGNDFDLVRASRVGSLRRSQSNYLRGDDPTVMMRLTRPSAYVESKDASGNTISVMPELAPIYTIAQAPAVAPSSKVQTLIDDYQGIQPGGSRGGSGAVVGPYTFKVEPDKAEDPMMPIDTRGNSTGTFSQGAGNAEATGGKSSGLMLPLLAVAAYYMLK